MPFEKSKKKDAKYVAAEMLNKQGSIVISGSQLGDSMETLEGSSRQ